MLVQVTKSGGGRTLIDGTEYEIGFNVSLEWKINEEPVIELGTKMYLNVSYTLPDYYGTAGTRLNIYNLGNGSIIGGMTQYGGATFYKDGWKDTTYRRILFDEPPAGELLNWLKDNAIQL